MKTITIWECQDCGQLYSKPEECFCCVDAEGNYFGKHQQYEIRKLGTYTAKQIKSLRPLKVSKSSETT